MRDNIGDEDENMLIINTNTLNNEKNIVIYQISLRLDKLICYNKAIIYKNVLSLFSIFRVHSICSIPPLFNFLMYN